MQQSHQLLETDGAMWVVRRRPMPGQRMQSRGGENDNTQDSSLESVSSDMGYTDIFMLPNSNEEIRPGIDMATGNMILSYMEGYLHDENRLSREWTSMESCDSGNIKIYEEAKKDINQLKHRPGAPIPFEHAVVRLHHGTNNYINASPVIDFNPRVALYISTPSPMNQTLVDFWQMIWEQSVTIVVCLERANELKQPSSLADNPFTSVQYWPNEGSQTYGPFKVHLVSEHNWCEDFVVRSLYVKNNEAVETRTITQFHYLLWHNSALDNDVKSLLQFRNRVNHAYKEETSPIVVHCIDGSGRSGTYILIDMVLNRIARGVKEINIAATLEHLRDQRQNMVQDKDQYIFAYTVIAEELKTMLSSKEQTN